jgi:hypothetical protein
MAKKKNTDLTHVHITPAGLESLCKDIWGDMWRAKFTEVTGITYSQLHRYMTIYKGQMIPQIVVVALVALRDLKHHNVTSSLITEYRRPIGEATPVKFVQEKKVRPAKPDTDAPLVDFFADPEPVKAPEPEAAPEPQQAAKKPAKAKTEPAKAKPAKAKTEPVKKPATERTGKAGPETKKAGPDRTKAKTEPAKATVKKPAPKRAALKKTA